MKIPDRRHYPQEEQYSWLTIVLDSYAICDEELQKEISREEGQRGVKAACAKGCYFCCLHHDIPVSASEFMGIAWYASEMLDPDVREGLSKKLAAQAFTTGCPFLLDGACCIYPLRPLACREFVVYRAPCLDGEDPYFSRPEDMHPANPQRKLRTAWRLLDSPVYGDLTKEKKLAAIEDGIMHKNIPGMHEIEWGIIIENMSSVLF